MPNVTQTAPPALESNAEWKDILNEILPAQGEWSEQEYLVLTDHRSRLIEYTDGRLEPLPRATDEHQALVKFMLFALCSFFERSGGVVHFAPLRLRIRPKKYREPDLLVLTTANDPRRHNRAWEGADLVLEVVSEEKPGRDLVDKVVDYAEGRVPEYWIVNPLNETITVLQLAENGYQKAGCYRRGQSAQSVLRPEFSVAVDGVFDAGKASKS
jgi:Uma2 family endonuclease